MRIIFRGVAQLASALAWGARGRLFESDHPDKEKTQSTLIQLIAFLFIWLIPLIYTTLGKTRYFNHEE